MRKVMTRVFPLPAPARISTGPSVVSTASRCCGFSWSRKDNAEVAPESLIQFYRGIAEGGIAPPISEFDSPKRNTHALSGARTIGIFGRKVGGHFRSFNGVEMGDVAGPPLLAKDARNGAPGSFWEWWRARFGGGASYAFELESEDFLGSGCTGDRGRGSGAPA